MTGEHHLGGRVVLHHGDSREVLKGMADCSVDSIVCDPPYALVSIVKRFGGANAAPAKGNDAYMRASAGFMSRTWDTGETAFAAEFWAECLRVLKPGGHALAFSGTRTYHRLACAIEDAGFEIRDMTAWLYGSGFPKSHDVSKGIAKRRVEDVEPVRVVCRFIREAMDDEGLKSSDLTQFFGDCNPRLIDHWAARDTDSQPALPTASQWDALVDALNLADRDDFEFVAREWARLNARKGGLSDEWTGAEVVGEIKGVPGGFGDHRFAVRDNLVRELKDEAAQWQGWGTALKPALEPIVLARKPLCGTVAANVLEHGTGALNIDGCRVATDDELAGSGNKPLSFAGQNARPYHDRDPRGSNTGSPLGRWPANVLHDGSDEVLAAFPDSNGQQGAVGPAHGDNPGYGGYGPRPHTEPRNDSGSAARFFYSAKADAMDRVGSKHPTVKPVDLMRYLCRLVTPPGGTVLDPFAGSGTTGEAAYLERFRCILIEREAEYCDDIRARLALADAGTGTRKRAIAKKKAAPAVDAGGQVGLFS